MNSAAKPKEERTQPGSPGNSCKCRSVCLPTAACVALSASSLALCFLMSIRTSHLERRVHALELGRAAGPALAPGPSLPDAVDALLQEKLNILMPKLRTARDVVRDCLCPPGVSTLLPNQTMRNNVDLHLVLQAVTL
ncbi:collagen alpha-1(XXIII) chain-like [Arapaima gigas]